MPKKPQQLAKLSRPRLYDALPRERLFRLLDESRRHPVTWISGPPGAGKTTLVATYLRERKLAGLWYHLDPEDRDPATLFYFLSTLAKQLPRGGRETLRYLTPEYLNDLPGFTRRYFRSFFARMPANSVLVLDNYHEAAGPELNRVLQTAFSELPEGRNAILISRSEAPADISRLVAGNHVQSLGWQELRLTQNECSAIAGSNGVTDARAIELLHTQSDGWIAGLVLMLASARRGQRAEDIQASDSKEAIFAYFAGEVFDRATADDRRTLVHTALFPRFTESMAVAISGNAKVADLLDQLFRKQYFTERSGTQAFTYRYHDLFREFLEEKAAEWYSANELQALFRNTGDILLFHGELEAAVVQYRKARDFAAIAAIVEENGKRMLSQGRWQQLTDWCAFAETGTKRPWVIFWRGLALAATDAHAARRVLEDVYGRFLAERDLTGQTMACSAIMDSYFQHWDTVAELDSWIERMEALLAEHADMPAEVRARALSSVVLSLLHRNPGHSLMPGYAEEAYSRIPKVEDLNLKFLMSTSLIYYYSLRGAFNRANQLIEMTAPYMGHPDLLPVNELTWCYRCGVHRMLTDDIAAAAKSCYRGLELARAHGTGWVGYVSAFMVEITQERYEQAGRLLAESRGLLDSSNRLHVIAVYWLELWLMVGTGKMEEAVALWKEFSRIPVAGVPIHTAFNHPVIFVMVHCGEYDEALAKVHRFRELLKEMNSPLIEFNFLCMEAYVRLKAGDATGRECLTEMMRIGRAHELFVTLSWVPPMMSYLCLAALEQRVEVDYVRKLIRSRGLSAPVAGVAAWPRPLKIMTLGRFEVLRDDVPVEYSRKAPRKLVMLLKLLVSCGSGGVTTQEVCDRLWGDLEADAAQEAFATNLHRLRKLLGRPEAIRLVEGRISVDTAQCWIDVPAFEDLFESSMAEWNRANADDAIRLAERATALYRGNFLPHDVEQPWSLPVRERLRARFIKLVSRTSAHYQECGEVARAMEWLQKGIDTDNLAEELYQGLIRCHVRLGRKAEGAAVYRQLKQILSVVLGIAPSEASLALGRQVMAASAAPPPEMQDGGNSHARHTRRA